MARFYPAITRRRTVYFGLAVIAFAIATFVADVRARVVLGGETLTFAIRDHLYYATVQIIGTMLLFAPYGGAAWWADRAEGRQRLIAARVIFLFFTLYVVWDYWTAYQLIPGYVARGMWTAAALTIGLLPFYSLGLLVLVVAGDWTVRTLIARYSGSSDRAA